jgi:hypothetical protein
MQLNHSLKAPGFNPRTYKVTSWFQNSFTFNLYRYNLVDLLSSLKCNHLQLYVENTVGRVGYMDHIYWLSPAGVFCHTPYHGWRFSPRYLPVKAPIDDSAYGPCTFLEGNQSDTRW